MLLLRILTRAPPPTAHILPGLRSCTLRPQLFRKSLPQLSLRRTFASAPGPRPAAASTPKSAGSGPGASGARGGFSTPKAPELPPKLLIYHAGTGRIAFLAFLKITTVFSAAFFCLVALPSWIRSGEDVAASIAKALTGHPRPQWRPWTDTSSASCGIFPLVFVAYTSASFVNYVYLRLPPYARQSRAVLERYVRTLPPNAQLEIGTMGLAGRPRAALTSPADLRRVPADAGILKTRSGTVNFERDVSALMAQRKWHQYRPASFFHLPEPEEGKRPSSSSSRTRSRGVKDGWVWNIVYESLNKRK
ncbi:hypothetical protein CMUS01_02700 [Colletotrichum musicola]|uniref:Uncharacterized protein n=1 Tax=Colletotrichum musicola TaxID=2175873 RepID=A0A8H6U7K3_9PEZI|nr:hypothetical protein CMUS01_02700 [Colletotrichum musicola]